MTVYRFSSHILLLLSSLALAVAPLMAQQDQESAEISLEEYSDEFQEYFFEALKQQGIENYDLAVKAFLECKKIEPDLPVLDFQLGKNYYVLKQYEEALPYLVNADQAAPNNIWYQEMLFRVYRTLNDSSNALRVGKKIVDEKPNFVKEVVNIYLLTNDLEGALTLLDQVESTHRATINIDSLRAYVVGKREKRTVSDRVTLTQDPTDRVKSELQQLEDTLLKLWSQEAFEVLVQHCELALVQFPSQPRLYEWHGKGLIKLGKYKEAISTLDAGLDYLVDDPKLEASFYRSLIQAHTTLKNMEKVKEYEQKLKKIGSS